MKLPRLSGQVVKGHPGSRGWGTPGFPHGSQGGIGGPGAGSVAYVHDQDSLRAVDVSDPSAPSVLGSVALPVSALDNAFAGRRGVTLEGSTAYVACGDSGLQIVDVSDPLKPPALGGLDTEGSARDVVVSAGIAYVADGSAGLQIIDVSDPSAPALLGWYATDDGVGLAVSGGVAFVQTNMEGLRVIDVTDPAAPAFLGSHGTGGDAVGVAVSGSVVYVAGGDAGLQILDMTDPGASSLLGSSDTRGLACEGGGFVTRAFPRLRLAALPASKRTALLAAGIVLVSTLTRLIAFPASIWDGNRPRYVHGGHVKTFTCKDSFRAGVVSPRFTRLTLCRGCGVAPGAGSGRSVSPPEAGHRWQGRSGSGGRTPSQLGPTRNGSRCIMKDRSRYSRREVKEAWAMRVLLRMPTVMRWSARSRISPGGWTNPLAMLVPDDPQERGPAASSGGPCGPR